MDVLQVTIPLTVPFKSGSLFVCITGIPRIEKSSVVPNLCKMRKEVGAHASENLPHDVVSLLKSIISTVQDVVTSIPVSKSFNTFGSVNVNQMLT
ncbi:hypothetical protein P5673_017280 [Acropora cervicornis]|uniref:Uncharacterized protein n=1 Tax=Acropora cervicornis TaxID=6130 RepID=A0AAD9QG22_ACRCE|nr:hypothetical protein P5673_017280 [Acropora cervicornis]